MRAFASGVAAILIAWGTAPPAPHPAAGFPAAPPLALVRAAALGRVLAASDLLWLRTIQMVGHPDAEARGYPHVDEWVDAITTLDPRFDYPYAFAAVLLSTQDRDRLLRVDKMLERGEHMSPDHFWFPLQRGFVAYFGLQDPDAAAAHYLRASTKSGAPPYAAAFAARIGQQKDACAQMPTLLGTLMRAQGERDARALRERAVGIVEKCVQAEWKVSSARARLAGEPDTLEALVASGAMAPPPAVPGLCWSQDSQGLPRLKSCEGAP